MAYDAESARSSRNMYGALRGPYIYKSLYNTERSRLELILFNNTRNDSVFMRDIRYLWTELDILLTKSVKKVHTVNWLKVSKKTEFMPKSI